MKKQIGDFWAVLTMISVFSAPIFAAGGGTTAVPFLTMGVGARALAMGEAATATANDATALYWNPAALLRMETQSATFMHAATLENSAYDYAAYGRTNGESAWGVGLQYFSAGDVDKTDNTGNNTGSLNPSDIALTGGYARAVNGYGVGVSAKYVQSKLVDTAKTLAADAGVMTPDFWRKKLRFGASLANFGGKIKYDQESAPLPMTLRGGMEVKPLKGLTGALDLVAPKGEDIHLALGGEYRLTMGYDLNLALRGGYNSRQSVGGNAEGLSAGVGFGWNKLTVDYAFVSHGDLDPGQIFSVGYGF
jgi:hypothetical protein